MGAMKDRLIEQQELAERVLADHQVESHGMTATSPDYCRCGETVWPGVPSEVEVGKRRATAFAAHQAQALADAWVDV